MRLLVGPLLLVGCAAGSVYTISISATTALTAKPATCDFRVVALPPSGDGYEEIATLTPRTSSYTAADPDWFKKVVREDVCRVGGDMVVTEVNGHGSYVRGTVLRARPATAAQP